MARTSADVPLRQRLRELKARLITDAGVREWHGDAATIIQVGGSEERIAADSLVIAATNVPERQVADELDSRSIGHRDIGDTVAARTAVMAIYEGRKTGMAI
jgi:hypothetical protein